MKTLITIICTLVFGFFFMAILSQPVDNISSSNYKQYLSRAERRAWQHQAFLLSEE